MNKIAIQGMFLFTGIILILGIFSDTKEKHTSVFLNTGKLFIEKIKLDSMKNDSMNTVETNITVSKCIFIEKEPRQFVNVIIKGPQLRSLVPGAFEYYMIIYDNNFIVTEVCFGAMSEGIGGLFILDVLTTFKDEVTVSINYIPSYILYEIPLMAAAMGVLHKVEGVRLNDILQPLDTTIYDSSVPVAESTWLKSKLPAGDTRGLIQKIPK